MPQTPEQLGPMMASLERRAFDMAKRPTSQVQRLTRVVEVLRHYPWKQIARRGFNVLAAKLQPNKLVGPLEGSVGALRNNPAAEELAKLVISMRSDHPSHQQCDLSAGEFTLLNKRCQLGSADRFDQETLSEQSHLWRFQFHYHEFLLTEAARGNWKTIGKFLSRWLTQFAPQQVKRREDAWHPYCISRRIPTWIWLLYQSGNAEDGLGDNLTTKLVSSLIQQANYLQRNLERDLGGNHLLENATALAIASGCLESSSATSWGSTARSILRAELPRQMLQHGEHFELSPVYHCQIVASLLRIESCCSADQQLQKVIHPFINPMLQFLSSIVHPDGEVPLFADSVFFESPSVAEIESHVTLNGRYLEASNASTIGGYEILRSGSAFLIADFGSIAAPNLPAHGHCDALNLEVSIEGQRWIVDSGNYNYDDDSMRHYCRSSIAHNAVTIDDENQAHIWSKFRMGSRPNVTHHQREERNGWRCISATHDGYQRRGVDSLTRIIAINEETIVCLDRAKPSGVNTTAKLCGYLHFHPLVEVKLEETATSGLLTFILTRDRVSRRLSVAAEEATIESGWHCPEFGKRIQAPAIRYVSSVFKGPKGWILHENVKACEIVSSKFRTSITLANQLPFEWGDECQK